MLKLMFLAASLSIFSATSLAQAIYTWRDAKGVVNFSDKLPFETPATGARILQQPATKPTLWFLDDPEEQITNGPIAATPSGGATTSGGPTTAPFIGSPPAAAPAPSAPAPSGTTTSSGTPTPPGLPPAGTNRAFQCSFETSPTDCGFAMEAAGSTLASIAGPRFSIVDVGREGARSVRLTTEPGDVDRWGGEQRSDLSITQSATGCNPGREHWWEHSILFPDDFNVPDNGWYTVADFHNSGPGGQANFHVDATRFDGPNLYLRGYGGLLTNSSDRPGLYQVKIGPIVKNAWYDFVYHVKWSSGADGYFDAWVNGVQVLAHRGPTLYGSADGTTTYGCYLKLANYHTRTTVPSSVIHDRVIRYDVNTGTGQ